MASAEQKQEHTQTEYEVSLFDFVRFQIQKLQNLIQLADSKAEFILAGNAALLTVTALFITPLFPDMRLIFRDQDLPVIVIYAAVLIVFVIAALVSMIQAFLVVYPRYTPFTKQSPHAPLLYFREIAHSHNSADEYNQALLASLPEEILANASSEIYGISVDAVRKFNLLNASTKSLIVAVIFWFLILTATLLFTPPPPSP